MDRIKAHFVGQLTRSELGMVSHGAFLQSKSLQSIYLRSYDQIRIASTDRSRSQPMTEKPTRKPLKVFGVAVADFEDQCQAIVQVLGLLDELKSQKGLST
jgi:hypothetical protein